MMDHKLQQAEAALRAAIDPRVHRPEVAALRRRARRRRATHRWMLAAVASVALAGGLALAIGGGDPDATTDGPNPIETMTTDPGPVPADQQVLLPAPLAPVPSTEITAGSTQQLFGHTSPGASRWSLRASSEPDGLLCVAVEVGPGQASMCGRPDDVASIVTGLSGTAEAPDDVYFTAVTRDEVAVLEIAVDGEVRAVDAITAASFPGVHFYVTGLAAGNRVSSVVGRDTGGLALVELPPDLVPWTIQPHPR